MVCILTVAPHILGWGQRIATRTGVESPYGHAMSGANDYGSTANRNRQMTNSFLVL